MQKEQRCGDGSKINNEYRLIKNEDYQVKNGKITSCEQAFGTNVHEENDAKSN